MRVLNKLNRPNPLQFPLEELPSPCISQYVAVYVSPDGIVYVIGDRGIVGITGGVFYDNPDTPHGYGVARYYFKHEILDAHPEDAQIIEEIWALVENS